MDKLKFKIGDYVICSEYNDEEGLSDLIGIIIDIDKDNETEEYFIEFFKNLKGWDWEGKTSEYGNNVRTVEGHCTWVYESTLKPLISPLKKFLKEKKS